MKITWFGHAAFLVEGVNPEGEAVRIILDPYNYPACGGYLPINEEADIVSISHHNERYHSDLSAIHGDYELIDALEHAGKSLTRKGVEFSVFEVYETDDGEGSPSQGGRPPSRSPTWSTWWLRPVLPWSCRCTTRPPAAISTSSRWRISSPPVKATRLRLPAAQSCPLHARACRLRRPWAFSTMPSSMRAFTAAIAPRAATGLPP